jgi:hypothetical protein
MTNQIHLSIKSSKITLKLGASSFFQRRRPLNKKPMTGQSPLPTFWVLQRVQVQQASLRVQAALAPQQAWPPP